MPLKYTGNVATLQFKLSGGAPSLFADTKLTRAAVINALLPSQSGNTNYILRSDGTNAGWVTLASLNPAISVTNDTSTNGTFYIPLTTATSGTVSGVTVSSSKLSFNPSTGIITATGLVASGNITLSSTGSIGIAAGTTAQRPAASFPIGSIRYNTSIAQLEVGDGSAFVPVYKGVLEQGNWTTASGSTTLIDLNNGSGTTHFRINVSASTTVTFTNRPTTANNEVFSFSVRTTNTAGGYSIAWGNTIWWAGGLAPSRTTTNGATDLWTFIIDNNQFYGSLAIIDAK